ncbi:MAG TPA: hypothetical protein VE198_14765 [Actinoallomurus sp.]|nr:hypothetical protein [Actinoallomurus sp.]
MAGRKLAVGSPDPLMDGISGRSVVQATAVVAELEQMERADAARLLRAGQTDPGLSGDRGGTEAPGCGPP